MKEVLVQRGWKIESGKVDKKAMSKIKGKHKRTDMIERKESISRDLPCDHQTGFIILNYQSLSNVSYLTV